MPNPYGAPEITCVELVARDAAGEEYLLLDVREPHELERARLPEGRFTLVPLSALAEQRTAALPAEALDKERAIVTMCHHGVRSAQVTAWLLQQGWTNVLSLAGGIDAYAKEVDPTIGVY